MNLLFLTNIPTPYRTSFYDALEAESRARGDSLHVLYCATTEPRRHWPYDPATMRHSHEVMPGWHLQLRRWHTHLNFRVTSRLERLRPGVVAIAGAWNTPTMLLALAWCRLHRVPVYFWSEGHSAAVLNPRGPVAWFRRRAYAAFDGFLVPNGNSASWAVAQAGPGKDVLSLPNSIDTSFFALPPGTSRGEWRARLGIDHPGPILIQVARVDAVKAPLELARAYAGLPEDYRRRSRLVFVGPGSQLEELRALASASKGSILVVGNVDAAKVREWLWASDVFVLNTKRDPNPLSPIEASSASMPILVSHLAGNAKELVQEGVTGWIISNPDDPSKELMRAIDCSPEQRASMGESARRLATSQFDARSVALNLLRQLHSSVTAGQ